jgi:hypothetical protein
VLRDTTPAIIGAAAATPTLVSAVERVRRDMRAALQCPPLVDVQPTTLQAPGDPSCGREDLLPGYRELARLRREYLQRTAPSAQDPYHREFLPSPDDVYEAYVAEMIAAAFDLSPVGRGLRDRATGPSFMSADWELWFDLAGAVLSWRRQTARPDAYRPDVVLRSRHDPKRVIVIDAKYAFRSPSEDGPGKGAPGARLKEVQAYVNAFGLDSIAVIHPGDSPPGALWVSDISAHGYLIRQVELNSVPVANLGLTLVALRCSLDSAATAAGAHFAEPAA